MGNGRYVTLERHQHCVSSPQHIINTVFPPHSTSSTLCFLLTAHHQHCERRAEPAVQSVPAAAAAALRRSRVLGGPLPRLRHPLRHPHEPADAQGGGHAVISLSSLCTLERFFFRNFFIFFLIKIGPVLRTGGGRKGSQSG